MLLGRSLYIESISFLVLWSVGLPYIAVDESKPNDSLASFFGGTIILPFSLKHDENPLDMSADAIILAPYP